MTKYLVAGGVTYAAARFVFDASPAKSVVATLTVIGLLYAALSIKLPSNG